MNKLINLLLLVVMSFSIAHGVVLDTHNEEHHCTVQEHAVDVSEMQEHEHETCDNHCVFHLSFLLPDAFSLVEIKQEVFLRHTELFTNLSSHPNNSFRPPIV